MVHWGRDLRDHIIEVEGASGIRILQKSRDGRVRKRGGGVALAFNTALCNFKPRQLKLIAKEHEVICAVGKVGKIDRKIVVFVTYIPPGMRANQIQQLRKTLAAEVSEAKAMIKDPVFIIAGDFNHRDIAGEVGLVEQITQVPSGPTRGPNTIDLVFTNTPRNIKECITLPPLETNNGNRSDHKCVYVAAEYKSQRKYEWVVKMRRLRDAKREEAFANDLRGWNFDGLCDSSDVDDMWQRIEEAVESLTEKHFPLVRVRKRSNESPWITRGIRRLCKKKIRVYKKEGKSVRWWDIDRLLHERIEKSRVEFVEKMLEEGNNGRSFYAATKRLAKAAVVPQWSVSDLFVGRPPQEVCQEVLAYFGGVASGAAPDLSRAPRCSGGLPEFMVAGTEELLKAVKKSDSTVQGDPLPHLVRCHAGAFAGPITHIFNAINTLGVWPKKWKTEHLTVIPKNPSPADLSECPNISCTSIFSKVMEGAVMSQLRKELLPDPCQYGGIPNCSVEYMLVDLWERILGALEGGSNAAVLLGVDYEKAFNRMRHDVCLDQLRELGASQGSISLVRAFLEGRSMTICIEGHRPSPVPISRGSPQGSVLGCLLYCVTMQRLTWKLRGNQGEVNPEKRYFPQASSDEEDIQFWTQSSTGWGRGDEEPQLGSFLYVDDTTLFDSVPMADGTRHFTTGATRETFENLALEGDFVNLAGRAEDIGMKINAKKTQLLVISPDNGCVTSAVIDPGDGQLVRSVDRMKLVGFTFGDTPSAGLHVESIEEQYKRKKWMLYHLRDAGLKGRQLYRLYCCYVRSSFEYCSPGCHGQEI